MAEELFDIVVIKKQPSNGTIHIEPILQARQFPAPKPMQRESGTGPRIFGLFVTMKGRKKFYCKRGR